MPATKPSLSHRVEYVGAILALKLFRLIGPRAASNTGGTIIRLIGPMISASRTAHRNLALAMPELGLGQRRGIVAATWENLGRTVAELAHVGELRETAAGPGFRISGGEHIEQAVQHSGPTLILTGHIGNWEILPAAMLSRGMNMAFMYRAAGNPLIDQLIARLRRKGGRDVTMFAKGSAGARGAFGHLTRNGDLAMLVDQKMDNGIAVPFFGVPAMTAPAIAAFALRFRCLVIPVHVVREGPARLHVICEPPLALPDTGDKAADTLTLMTIANNILERWIREVPGSWLWLHRRWPKQVVATVA